MEVRNIRALHLFLMAWFCFYSCAIIEPPPGGEKDTEPPKIKKSNPTSGSKNFKKNSIELEFDEYVVQNNLSQELLVSPPLKHKPSIKVTGKKLEIKLKDTLAENTTYTISLGAGIKDYREGNILDSNIVVFSTGPYIDSGIVRGKVQHAETRQAEPNVLVMLYNEKGDSIPSKKRPRYYSKTNENGEFTIKYIKTGTYRLFCLEDQNNNYLYDLPNERIGFVLEDVSAADSSAAILHVYLFQEAIQKQFLKGSKVEEYGKFLLGFNRPVQDLQIKLLGESKKQWKYSLEFDLERDTAWVWTNFEVEADEKIKLEIMDQSLILDTIELELKPFPSDTVEQKKLNPKISTSVSNGVAKYFEPLRISLSRPIDTIRFSGYLIDQKDTVPINQTRVKKVQDYAEFNYSLKQEHNYQLILYPGSMTDVLGLTHDTFRVSFKTLSDMEYANLNVELTARPTTSTIVVLMTEKGEELKRVLLNGHAQNISFKNLSPGKYGLKMIYDENQNGKWDTGTYIPRKLPEKVIFFSGEIEMKEGWDKKIEWTIPE